MVVLTQGSAYDAVDLRENYKLVFSVQPKSQPDYLISLLSDVVILLLQHSTMKIWHPKTDW